MKAGALADHFRGVGAKFLTATEISPQTSNQHEFQGVGTFRQFLGTPSEKLKLPATFLWLDDSEDAAPPAIQAFCTWSDVRRAKPGRSPEYHLYYASDSAPLIHRAAPGDLLFIAQKQDASLLVIVSPAGSTASQQLLWLFGLNLLPGQTDARDFGTGSHVELSSPARRVLEAIGVETAQPEPDAFGAMLDRFGLKFPPTAELSAFARSSLAGVDPREDPDGALVAWMDQEEALFRHLECRIVAGRLKTGFHDGASADVDGFLSFSLSVQNRRKSRAGYAFAHHTEEILKAHAIAYKREATTEKRNAADFLFPGEAEYHNPDFPTDQLRMLAVKTSCKDRWRQVLAEAGRISTKHLLTLEPAISPAQTSEMACQGLHLVLPAPLHETFRKEQQSGLLSIRGFIDGLRS